MVCSPSAKIRSEAASCGTTWVGDHLTHHPCLGAIAGIFVPLVVELHEIRGLYFLAISISHAGTALRFLLVGFVLVWEKQQQQLLEQTGSYAFVSFSPTGLISFLAPDYLLLQGVFLKFSFSWL